MARGGPVQAGSCHVVCGGWQALRRAGMEACADPTESLNDASFSAHPTFLPPASPPHHMPHVTHTYKSHFLLPVCPRTHHSGLPPPAARPARRHQTAGRSKPPSCCPRLRRSCCVLHAPGGPPAAPDRQASRQAVNKGQSGCAGRQACMAAG